MGLTRQDMANAHWLYDLRRISITYITWNNLLHLGAIILIELHVTRFFNPYGGLVVESIGVGIRSISNKNTLNSSRFKFTEPLSLVLDEALAPEDTEVLDVGLIPGEKLISGLVVEGMDEEPVRCMNRGGDGFSPKIVWGLEFIQHSSCHLNDCPVLPLHNTILLGSVWSGELVLDAFPFNEVLHGVVLEFGAIVGSNRLDHFIVCALSLLGEVDEALLGLILGLEKEYPSVP